MVLGFVVCAANTARAEEQRLPALALISGEGNREPAALDFSKLETSLSGDGNIAVIEREQIRKVMAEQKLSASGLADPVTSARLGRLLAADLFLFIDKLPGEKMVVWRAQIVEANSGVVLQSVMEKADNLASDSTLLREAIRLAIAKFNNPPEHRHYVALLGVRSEEPGRILEPAAAALESLLPADINVSSALVLLDREHLQHLRAEESIAGRYASIKTSAVAVEASLKHDDATNSLAVNLVFRPLAGGESVRRKIVAPLDDMAALRRLTSSAIHDQFQTTPPTNALASPRDEAVLFARKAQILASFDQMEEAARAAEAAVALYPHRDICETASQCISAWGNSLIPESIRKIQDGRYLRFGEPGYKDYPTATKISLFKALLRELDLEELGREFAARHPEEAKRHLPLFAGGVFYGGMESCVDIHPHETTVMELRRELFERKYTRHLRLLDEYARRWNEPNAAYLHDTHPQLAWLQEMGDNLGNLKNWAVDDRHWARLIQTEINRALNPPGPIDERWDKFMVFGWFQFPLSFYDYDLRTPEERRFVCNVLENLQGQTNALIHLAVRRAILYTIPNTPAYREQYLAESRNVLNVFLNELPPSHPARQSRKDDGFFRSTIEPVFMVLPEGAEKCRYARAIFEAIAATRDWQRLETWTWAFYYCSKFMPAAERTELAERLLALTNAPDGSHPFPENSLVENFVNSTLPGRLPKRDDWRNYEIRPLITGDSIRGQIMASTVFEKELILVWHMPIDSTQALVTITRSPADMPGGKIQTVGKAVLPSVKTAAQDNSVRIVSTSTPGNNFHFTTFRYKETPYICHVAADQQILCAGTLQGGLMICRDGMVQTYTRTNGLPDDRIDAVAVAGGKVFLGVSGLIELDPSTKIFRELASSLSSQGRNPLDGVRNYRVTTLIWEEGSPCLKLQTSVPNAGGDCWNYDLKTGLFEKRKESMLQKTRPRLGGEEFAGSDGFFIYKTNNQPPVIINHLPDGQALSPMRGVLQAKDSILLILPHEVWSLKNKPLLNEAKTNGRI